MGGSIEPLAVGKVIGDVVDPFIPTAKITVHFGSKQVANGCDIKPSLAAHTPHLRILPLNNTNHINATNNLYTLVMVDPDAPSPSEPTYREWLHWIVVNIPEGCEASQGREVVSYMGPNPRTGIHRYVFVAFKQSSGEEEVEADAEEEAQENRANFNTRLFASKHALALPVAAIYFNSQKESKTKTTRR